MFYVKQRYNTGFEGKYLKSKAGMKVCCSLWALWLYLYVKMNN